MTKPASYVLLNILAAVCLVGGAVLVHQGMPEQPSAFMVANRVPARWDVASFSMGLTAMVTAVLLYAAASVVGLLAEIRDGVARGRDAAPPP